MATRIKYLSLVLIVSFMVIFIYLVAEPVDGTVKRADVDGSQYPNVDNGPRPSLSFAERAARLAQKKPKYDPDEEMPYFVGPRPLTRHQLGRRAWYISSSFLYTAVI